MSFSGDIKLELNKRISPSRHCQLAELAGLYIFCGKIEHSEDNTKARFVFSTENEQVLRKAFTLLKKTFNMIQDWTNVEEIDDIVKALTSDFVTERLCCKRAFLRGAFLSCGTVSNPEKSYHMEIMCPDESWAHELVEIFASFDIEVKILQRAKNYTIYIKDGSQIADALSVMEAGVAMMEYENARILKDMRNSVNRKVNCETANINKTVAASMKQVEEIRELMGTKLFMELPANVQRMAQLRIEYPDATLKELGELSDPPIGKSGVNHRLRKLSVAAMQLKEENYDKKGNNNPS